MNISDLDHLDVIVETSNILGGEASSFILTKSIKKVANIYTDISSDFDDGKGLGLLYQNVNGSEDGNKVYSSSTVWTPPGTNTMISLSSLVKVAA